MVRFNPKTYPFYLHRSYIIVYTMAFLHILFASESNLSNNEFELFFLKDPFFSFLGQNDIPLEQINIDPTQDFFDIKNLECLEIKQPQENYLSSNFIKINSLKEDHPQTSNLSTDCIIEKSKRKNIETEAEDAIFKDNKHFKKDIGEDQHECSKLKSKSTQPTQEGSGTSKGAEKDLLINENLDNSDFRNILRSKNPLQLFFFDFAFCRDNQGMGNTSDRNIKLTTLQNISSLFAFVHIKDEINNFDKLKDSLQKRIENNNNLLDAIERKIEEAVSIKNHIYNLQSLSKNQRFNNYQELQSSLKGIFTEISYLISNLKINLKDFSTLYMRRGIDELFSSYCTNNSNSNNDPKDSHYIRSNPFFMRFLTKVHLKQANILKLANLKVELKMERDLVLLKHKIIDIPENADLNSVFHKNLNCFFKNADRFRSLLLNIKKSDPNHIQNLQKFKSFYVIIKLASLYRSELENLNMKLPQLCNSVHVEDKQNIHTMVHDYTEVYKKVEEEAFSLIDLPLKSIQPFLEDKNRSVFSILLKKASVLEVCRFFHFFKKDLMKLKENLTRETVKNQADIYFKYSENIKNLMESIDRETRSIFDELSNDVKHLIGGLCTIRKINDSYQTFKKKSENDKEETIEFYACNLLRKNFETLEKSYPSILKNQIDRLKKAKANLVFL